MVSEAALQSIRLEIARDESRITCTVRGAVSMVALQDPLDELVKIDANPSAGQYQHEGSVS